jgi:uncharacterized protein (TIGR00297 family)
MFFEWMSGRGASPWGSRCIPLVVLLLIVTFRRNLPLAAAGWGYLAFGDGFASIVGMTLGGPRLPWNPKKSLSGFLGYLVFGFLGAAFLYGFVAVARPVRVGDRLPPRRGARGRGRREPAVGAGRQLLPPLVGAAALALLLPCRAGALDALEPAGLRGVRRRPRDQRRGGGLAAALRVVRPSGAVAGALLGTVVLGFGGAGLYVLLWVFFAGGTLATRLGKARKEAMGKAEEKGGRRGAANVLANVSVAAFCALAAGLGPHGGALRLAAAAALATALMDTVGTEVGQAVASPTVLLPDFRRVPPGTDGAVSVAGTAAGSRGGRAPCRAGVAAFVFTGAGRRRRGRRGVPRHRPREPSRARRRAVAHLERARPQLREHARGRGGGAGPPRAPRRPRVTPKTAVRLTRPFTLLPPLVGVLSGAVCAFGSVHNTSRTA